jgi:hypothetical protein
MAVSLKSLNPKYAPDAMAVVSKSQSLADAAGHARVTVIHLAAALFEHAPPPPSIMSSGLDLTEARRRAEAALRAVPERTAGTAVLAASLQFVLEEAERVTGKAQVSLDNLVWSLAYATAGGARAVLARLGITKERFPAQGRAQSRLRAFAALVHDAAVPDLDIASPLPDLANVLREVDVPGLVVDLGPRDLHVHRSGRAGKARLNWDPASASVMARWSDESAPRLYVSSDGGQSWHSTAKGTDLTLDFTEQLETSFYPEVAARV